MLLNLDWHVGWTFMQNLSQGYVLRFDDFFEKNCTFQNGFKLNCEMEHLYFYFKYLAIIPMMIFLFGLFGYLKDSE
jgi:hypothetical protein